MNTQFYTPEMGWRLTRSARELLRDESFISSRDRRLLRSLVVCERCGSRCYDYVGISPNAQSGASSMRGRKLYRVCTCFRRRDVYRDGIIRLLPQDTYVPGFFSIGDCEYDGAPLFLENINEW